MKSIYDLPEIKKGLEQATPERIDGIIAGCEKRLAQAKTFEQKLAAQIALNIFKKRKSEFVN